MFGYGQISSRRYGITTGRYPKDGDRPGNVDVMKQLGVGREHILYSNHHHHLLLSSSSIGSSVSSPTDTTTMGGSNQYRSSSLSYRLRAANGSTNSGSGSGNTSTNRTTTRTVLVTLTVDDDEFAPSHLQGATVSFSYDANDVETVCNANTWWNIPTQKR